MAPRRVRVSYGRTVQPVPFESIKLQVEIEKDIGEEEHLQTKIDETVDGLKKYVKKKIASIMESDY